MNGYIGKFYQSTKELYVKNTYRGFFIENKFTLEHGYSPVF
jgi:hypothetical protein